MSLNPVSARRFLQSFLRPSSYVNTQKKFNKTFSNSARPFAGYVVNSGQPRNYAPPLCRAIGSSRPRNQTQEAPNAKTYLESGAISGARDLVDVSKVLVIGSGGLSIGQAGEFDYSGEVPKS